MLKYGRPKHFHAESCQCEPSHANDEWIATCGFVGGRGGADLATGNNSKLIRHVGKQNHWKKGFGHCSGLPYWRAGSLKWCHLHDVCQTISLSAADRLGDCISDPDSMGRSLGIIWLTLYRHKQTNWERQSGQRVTNVLTNKPTERNNLKLKTGLMAEYLAEWFNDLVNGRPAAMWWFWWRRDYRRPADHEESLTDV
jgi:hypothetical protein